jgi:hypothetical protein
MSVSLRTLSRPLRVFLRSRLGIVVVLAAAIVGTTTLGFAGAITTGLIYACVNNSSGTIKIVSATTSCANNEILLVWNGEGTQGPAGPTGPTGPTGATGPAGSFSGTFTSPNGLCSIKVTDTGISFGSPACPIQVDTSNLRVMSGNTIDLRSGNTIDLRSGASTSVMSGSTTTITSSGTTTVSSGGLTTVNGGTVILGGGNTCSGVARIGDRANETGSVATIFEGSADVIAC